MQPAILVAAVAFVMCAAPPGAKAQGLLVITNPAEATARLDIRRLNPRTTYWSYEIPPNGSLTLTVMGQDPWEVRIASQVDARTWDQAIFDRLFLQQIALGADSTTARRPHDIRWTLEKTRTGERWKRTEISEIADEPWTIVGGRGEVKLSGRAGAATP